MARIRSPHCGRREASANMGQTLFEKLWKQHCVADLSDGAGLLAIDRILLHERTGGVALKSLRAARRSVKAPRQVFVTMDHIVDTLPGRGDATLMPTGSSFITATREAATSAGLTLFDIGDERQGIVHVISPEQGIVLPGVTLVCPDSHTCTQGALGALAWGIGSTEAEHALATSTLRVRKPRTMRITVDGALEPGVTAKDLALHLIAQLGASGAGGYIVEFAGTAVRGLDVEARMTLCNMATELGAFSAVIAPDEKTFSYVQGRTYAPGPDQWDQALASWKALVSDDDAQFDVEHRFDAAHVARMVTWGTNPQQAVPLFGGRVPAASPDDAADASRERARDYMDVERDEAVAGLRIDAAFIGSCTNARLSDLRRAAAVLQGRKVAPHVRAICVPGSTRVKTEAEAEGLDRIFLAAGFEWREAGCSMCFFAGGESFGHRERVISSTNRNFESRQGPETRTHLASPEVVAASAIAGQIASPEMI